MELEYQEPDIAADRPNSLWGRATVQRIVPDMGGVLLDAVRP